MAGLNLVSDPVELRGISKNKLKAIIAYVNYT